jgi:hypothetical protein
VTRLLLRLLEAWTGERYVPMSAILDVASPESDCGRLIRQWALAERVR